MHQPDTYPSQATERCPEVLETWLHYSPESQPSGRDFEDWAENAYMMHLAHLTAGEVRILPRVTGYHFSGDLTPAAKSNPAGGDSFMYGMWQPLDAHDYPADLNPIGNNAEIVRLVQNYPFSPVFLKAAGRAFHVASAEFASVESALQSIHAAGHRKAFIKTRFKGTAALYSLSEDPSSLWRDVANAHDEWQWFLVSHEGMKDCLFIQEAFEPTREYRMIIVGDEPVTGAGCIEAFTPIDNDGEDFDPRMEPIRNLSNYVEDRETRDRYLAFARDYAIAWAAENGPNACYSLDLAIDAASKQIVAIEMNPLLNLGLYACRPERMIQKLWVASQNR